MQITYSPISLQLHYLVYYITSFKPFKIWGCKLQEFKKNLFVKHFLEKPSAKIKISNRINLLRVIFLDQTFNLKLIIYYQNEQECWFHTNIIKFQISKLLYSLWVYLNTIAQRSITAVIVRSEVSYQSSNPE